MREDSARRRDYFSYRKNFHIWLGEEFFSSPSGRRSPSFKAFMRSNGLYNRINIYRSIWGGEGVSVIVIELSSNLLRNNCYIEYRFNIVESLFFRDFRTSAFFLIAKFVNKCFFHCFKLF